MPDLFNSVFADESQSTLSVGLFLCCILVALVCGGIYLAAFSFRERGSRSMRLSLTLLPAAVCVVIMMVNGNVGAGVAVAGVVTEEGVVGVWDFAVCKVITSLHVGSVIARRSRRGGGCV